MEKIQIQSFTTATAESECNTFLDGLPPGAILDVRVVWDSSNNRLTYTVIYRTE